MCSSSPIALCSLSDPFRPAGPIRSLSEVPSELLERILRCLDENSREDWWIMLRWKAKTIPLLNRRFYSILANDSTWQKRKNIKCLSINFGAGGYIQCSLKRADGHVEMETENRWPLDQLDKHDISRLQELSLTFSGCLSMHKWRMDELIAALADRCHCVCKLRFANWSDVRMTEGLERLLDSFGAGLLHAQCATDNEWNIRRQWRLCLEKAASLSRLQIDINHPEKIINADRSFQSAALQLESTRAVLSAKAGGVCKFFLLVNVYSEPDLVEFWLLNNRRFRGSIVKEVLPDGKWVIRWSDGKMELEATYCVSKFYEYYRSLKKKEESMADQPCSSNS